MPGTYNPKPTPPKNGVPVVGTPYFKKPVGPAKPKAPKAPTSRALKPVPGTPYNKKPAPYNKNTTPVPGTPYQKKAEQAKAGTYLKTNPSAKVK